MIADRGLRFALCAVLLLAPLAALSAQEMQDMMVEDEGSFYVTAAASLRFPAERDVFDGADTIGVGT